MAGITATFLANFDQFVGEVKRADTALTGMGTSATRVSTEANTSFASMGATVRNLAGVFGVALSVGAVVQFGKSVIDTASRVHDMSLKLGISAEAVQGFKFAAEQAGSTIDTVGTAITRMNVNLSEGGKGTVAALKAAGLEFANIRSMKPEDAFLAITDAIQRIPDPMLRSEVALQLFGKSAADLLPAIQEGFRGTADAASKMSNETIDSLQRAQDAWEKVGNQFVIITGTMLAATIDFFKKQSEATYGGGLDYGTLGTAAGKAAKDIELLPPVIQKTTEALGVEEGALKTNTAEKNRAAKAAKDLAEEEKKLRDVLAEQWDKGLTSEGFLRSTQFTPEIMTGPMAGESHSAAVERAHGMVEEANAFAEAQEEANRIAHEGVLIVGAVANAHAVAGDAAAAGTDKAIVGYNGLTEAAQRAAAAISIAVPHGFDYTGAYEGADNPFSSIAHGTISGFGSRPRRIGGVAGGATPMGGGVIVNVNASNSFLNTPSDTQRLAETVGNSVKSQLMANGRQVG